MVQQGIRYDGTQEQREMRTLHSAWTRGKLRGLESLAGQRRCEVEEPGKGIPVMCKDKVGMEMQSHRLGIAACTKEQRVAKGSYAEIAKRFGLSHTFFLWKTFYTNKRKKKRS